MSSLLWSLLLLALHTQTCKASFSVEEAALRIYFPPGSKQKMDFALAGQCLPLPLPLPGRSLLP